MIEHGIALAEDLLLAAEADQRAGGVAAAQDAEKLQILGGAFLRLGRRGGERGRRRRGRRRRLLRRRSTTDHLFLAP